MVPWRLYWGHPEGCRADQAFLLCFLSRWVLCHQSDNFSLHIFSSYKAKPHHCLILAYFRSASFLAFFFKNRIFIVCLIKMLIHLLPNIFTFSEQDASLEIKYKHKKSSSKEKHSFHKHSSDREFRSREVNATSHSFSNCHYF